MSASFDFRHPAPDGRPVGLMDWPESGSPIPRISISINRGMLLVRANEAMRRLVLSTVEEPQTIVETLPTP